MDIFSQDVNRVEGGFSAMAFNSILSKLTQASVNLKDAEKARKYGEMWKEYNLTTGLSNAEETERAYDMLMSRLEPHQDQEENGNIRLLKDMYNSAVESEGKDSQNAVKMASCIAKAYVECRRYRKSLPW